METYLAHASLSFSMHRFVLHGSVGVPGRCTDTHILCDLYDVCCDVIRVDWLESLNEDIKVSTNERRAVVFTGREKERGRRGRMWLTLPVTAGASYKCTTLFRFTLVPSK
jgi:hypothetical protein